MAEKAIRLGGESTAAAIAQTRGWPVPRAHVQREGFRPQAQRRRDRRGLQLCSPELLEGCPHPLLPQEERRAGPDPHRVHRAAGHLWPGHEQLHLLRPGAEPEKLCPPCAGHRELRHSGRQREDEHHHRHQDRQQLRRKRQGRCLLLVRQRPVWPRHLDPHLGGCPRLPHHRRGRRHHRYGHRHELRPDLRLLWRQGGYADAALPRSGQRHPPSGHRHAAAAGACSPA